MKYEHTIDIDSSPAVVWATLSDVPAWPTWTASVTGAEWVGESGLAPVIGALTARIGRRYVAMEADGLKRHCEERA